MSAELKVSISSFSYKCGLPPSLGPHGGGFVFDCRCLPNPGREERYKLKTGRDPEVIEFIEKTEIAMKFYGHVISIIDLAIQQYRERGFTELMICFGCTGGQHRSVFFAEKLARHLREDLKVQADVTHRDCDESVKACLAKSKS